LSISFDHKSISCTQKGKTQVEISVILLADKLSFCNQDGKIHGDNPVILLLYKSISCNELGKAQISISLISFRHKSIFGNQSGKVQDESLVILLSEI